MPTITPNLRNSGISLVGEIPWGSHFCHLFYDKEDLSEILVPYLRAGLENNEACVLVTARPLGKNEARLVLRAEIPLFDEYRKKGQIEILDFREWFTVGDRFDGKKVIEGWIDKHDQAISRGFDGLRLSGNTVWVSQAEWNDFIAYERDVDRKLAGLKILALSAYSQKKCGAGELADIVSNHQYALIKRGRRWERIENIEGNRVKDRLAHLASFPDLNPNPVMELDTDGLVIYLNPSARTEWRNLLRDGTKNPLAEFWPKLVKELEMAPLKPIIRELQVDGSVYHLTIMLLPRERYIRVYGIDVTARQERLHETEDQLRLLTAQVPAIIWVTDSQLTITSYTGSAVKTLGVTPSDRIGTKIANPDMALEDADQKTVMTACRQALGGVEARYKLTTKGRYWESCVSPFRDASGEIIGIIGVSYDTTDIQERDIIIEESEQQLKALSIKLLHTQEQERKRLAADIHDSIGQYLAAIGMRIKSAQHFAETEQLKETVESLGSLLPLVQQSVQEVRRIQSDLRPAMLDELGIIATIGWYVKQYKATYPLIHISRRLDAAEEMVPDNLKIIIYRVIQESMTNTAKHSGADSVTLLLSINDNSLTLKIADNGRGLADERAQAIRMSSGGLGLTSMRERVQMSGGTFSITSKTGQGTEVNAAWPINP